MATETQVTSIVVRRDGLAEIREAGVLVGLVLALTFLYRAEAGELVNSFPGLTHELINAAFEYAADNPDTVEGQFYYSVDPCPLMRVLGLL